MLSDSQNFTIEGGTFTNVGGDIHVHRNLFYGDGERGLQSLGQTASLGAIHDSSERYPPPSCHAETRLEVRRMMLDWTKDKNATSSMLWLYGSVGVGKSAIIQSVAEQLALEQGGLGVATFFFSAGKADRNQGKFLVPTIAYQLAFKVPELRIHINSAMVCNPALHTKAIPVQMQHLIVEPFGKLAAPLQIVPTVLVDGLDECENHDIQKLVITLIGEALIKHKLPIRFVVASRPEAHIRETFDTVQLRSITHRIPLDESFQASRDIKKYLEDGFRDIHQQKAHVMTQVATPWPEEGVIDLLVYKASGQFIYAATVLKFVGAEYCRPTAQLAIVLQPKPSSAKPFAELDHLYHQILSSHNDPKTLVCVFETFIHLQNEPAEVTEDILGMEAGELSLVLRGLHSVIYFPQSPVDSFEGNVYSDLPLGPRFFHASFREYLGDPDRSGPFFIDEKIVRGKMPFLVFELLSKCISQSSSEEFYQRIRPRTWGFLRRSLHSYLEFCSREGLHRLLDLIIPPIQDLWNLDTYPQIQLSALHCAMTFVTAQIAITRKSAPGMWFDRHLFDVMPYEMSDHPLEERERSDETDEDIDQRVIEIFKKLRSILDRYYDLLLSRSPEFDEFLLSVPGFIAIDYGIPTSELAQILDVDVGTLESYIERNKCFMISQERGPTFDPHFIDYLCNQRRSGARYHDKRVDYIFLCRRFISLYIHRHGSELARYIDHEHPPSYLASHFQKILDSLVIFATDSADHPLWILLHYLEEGPFYPPRLQDVEALEQIMRIWTHTYRILEWVQKQQQRITAMNTSLHVNFERKLDALIDRIYSQVLYVESTFEGPTITLRSPILAALKYNAMTIASFLNADPQNPPPFVVPPVHEARDIIEPPRLSQDITFLHTIFPSLQQYLTSPTRAQGMYISKDAFHTQLAELLLVKLPVVPGFFWDSDSPLVDINSHLMLASGTQKIYDGLRGPMSWPLRNYGPYTAQTFSHGVITWLESLEKPPLDIYLGYQLLLLQADAAVAEEEEMVAAARRNNAMTKPYWRMQFHPLGEMSEVPEPEPETQPTADTDSTTLTLTVLPTSTKPRWKSVLEGIGDEYHRLAFLLLEYFYFVLCWHRRYLA